MDEMDLTQAPMGKDDDNEEVGILLGFLTEKAKQLRAISEWQEKLKSLFKKGIDLPKLQDYIACINEGQDIGGLSEVEGFWLKGYLLQFATDLGDPLDLIKNDKELPKISQKIKAIEKTNGLSEDESWLLGDGPEEWEKLQQEWNARHDAIIADFMRQHGEYEMAHLYEKDNDEFNRRMEIGRKKRQAR